MLGLDAAAPVIDRQLRIQYWTWRGLSLGVEEVEDQGEEARPAHTILSRVIFLQRGTPEKGEVRARKVARPEITLLGGGTLQIQTADPVHQAKVQVLPLQSSLSLQDGGGEAASHLTTATGQESSGWGER
mgnify:CR=1 FL=1